MRLPALWEHLPFLSPLLERGARRHKESARRRPTHRAILRLQRLEERTVPSATWVEQGPGVILGQAASVELPAQDYAATGAVEALAVSPANADIAYAGSVNGGVWRTDNFTTANPVWRPLTDQQLPFLDINSVAVSPVNPNEIFAGAGLTSAFGQSGPSFGVGRSLDGGKHWQVLGADVLYNQSIRSIVPTSLNGGQVVLAGAQVFNINNNFGHPSFGPGGGVYRSTDGGVTWTQLSGAPGTGLPAEGVSDLVADPGNPSRFYAAVEPWAFGATGNEGVYRSDDGGQTWRPENNGLTGLATSGRILLAVHNSAAGNAVYAMVIAQSGLFGKLSGVFRSTDQGADWTALGAPPIDIYQNGQGWLHGAIAADPINPNVVYISGDGDFPTPTTEFGIVLRADASQAPGNIWAKACEDGANNTAPHPDSRVLVFDGKGNLVEGSDGGIARLDHPNNAAVRQWRYVSSGLSDVEFHNVAYDPLSKVIFGGTQDNGTPVQVHSGQLPWDVSTTVPGDGGCVAVDADQTAHPGTSIRYNSAQFLGGFNRSTWDAGNHFLGSAPVGLNIVAGPGAGQNLLAFDPFVQFYNPITVNTVDSRRLLIGTAGLYESLDRGDTLTNLNFANGFYVGGKSVSDFILPSDGYGQPMVYGGHLGRAGNPDVIWAGVGNQVVYREHRGDPVQAVSGYHGDFVQTIVADPQDYRHVFVVDGSSQVWASFDAGKTFLNLTANLTQLTPFVPTIELVSTGPGPLDKMLVAGGVNGVFALGPGSSWQHPWYRLGDNLPHAVVLDLHYNASDHLLLAGTLGRGAWTLKEPFGEVDSTDGVGGASLATGIPAASLATFSQAPAVLDAFFAALVSRPADRTGSVAAGGDFLGMAAALLSASPTRTVIPTGVALAPATPAPVLPAGTDPVIPPPARESGTPAAALARRAAHVAAGDWGADALTPADLSGDGQAAI